MSPASSRQLQDSFTMSLWKTWRLMLKTYPTEHVQVALGLWSILWGAIVGNPLTHSFGLSPHAYAWMAPVPEWVWGLAWIGKGAWQARAGLRLARGRLLLPASDPERGRLAAGCVAPARLAVMLSSALVVGFALHLGPWNLFVFWYAALAVVNGWILDRAVNDRR